MGYICFWQLRSLLFIHAYVQIQDERYERERERTRGDRKKIKEKIGKLNFLKELKT